MENEKIKILVVVKGGVVQSIYSSCPNSEFEVLDFDNEESTSAVKEENILISRTVDLVPSL